MGLRKKYGTAYYMPNFGGKPKDQREKRLNVIRKIVKSQINNAIETKEKRYDFSAVGIDPIGGSAVSFASVSYGSSTCIAQLCRGIITGTGEGTRVGHEILLRGIYLNFAVQCASGTESNNFRICIIRPKGTFTTTSVAALAQQIFANQASASTQWLQPIDTDFFDVLYDKKRYIMPQDISGVGSVQERFFTKFLKFKNGIRMKWNEADSQPNRDIFLVAISDSSAVSHPGAVAGFCRLYYKDA